MAAIIDLKEQFGVFAANAQKVTMKAETLNWPRRIGGVSAFFDNSFSTRQRGTGCGEEAKAAGWRHRLREDGARLLAR